MRNAGATKGALFILKTHMLSFCQSEWKAYSRSTHDWVPVVQAARRAAADWESEAGGRSRGDEGGCPATGSEDLCLFAPAEPRLAVK